MRRKILFFNHASTIGGAGLSLLDIVRSVDKEQFETVIYTVSDTTVIANILENEGYRVIRAGKSPVPFSHFNGGYIPAYSPRFIKNLLRIILDIKHIRNAIRAEKPDIVMVNSMTLWWIGCLAECRKCHTVCFDRETFVHGLVGFRTKVMKRMMDRYFDSIAFISQFDCDECRVKKAKSTIIYDCVDIAKYQIAETKKECRKRLDLPEESYLVLFAGGNSYLKGAHILYHALNQIDNGQINYVILHGDRPNELHINQARSRNEKEVLEAYVDIAHKERLTYCGTVTNIQDYYCAADLVVFPSALAHQARPIYEAGAAKRLILVSDFPNTAEHIKNRVNGLTFAALDSKDLAKKIMYAVSVHNTPEEQKMIMKNTVNTETKHDLLQLKDKLKQVLERQEIKSHEIED